MKAVEAMNAALHATYSRGWEALDEEVARVPGASRPFVIRVPDGYESSARRLLIVGQETFGWGWQDGAPLASPRQLMDLHAEFELGRHYTSSPFWRGAHELHRRVDPTGEHGAFLWSNLVRVDCQRRRPPKALEEHVASLRWLNEELAITKPDVVVFFTGPRYDDRLSSQFSGLTYVDLGDGLRHLRHAELPVHSYRTYHPKYLVLSGRWGQLERIAAAVRGD